MTYKTYRLSSIHQMGAIPSQTYLLYFLNFVPVHSSLDLNYCLHSHHLCGQLGHPGRFTALTSLQKRSCLGRLGGSVAERLSLAQGMIPESQDQVPHWAPRLLLPLPMSLPLNLSHE